MWVFQEFAVAWKEPLFGYGNVCLTWEEVYGGILAMIVPRIGKMDGYDYEGSISVHRRSYGSDEL